MKDVISREIVHNVLKHYLGAENYKKTELYKNIRDIPTAYIETNNSGHWKYSRDLEIVCSECGMANETETNYCPICGAKMR